MAKTPLAGAVFAPPIVKSASARRVLTTEWVIGERLELSPAADVDKLCSLAMNTYLTMLLDTGTLHCDPHPGNLLRTPDGRLCILDWGLVSEIRPDIQIYLIEHVAHLTSQDYRKVPADLVALGFVPEGKEAAIQDTDAVEVLTSVYAQFAGGGGAAKIDVGLVINELTGLSEKYGNLFQLPPYFAYIARAFGVLEGIGLSNNPNYAIVGECLPYVSQRLLTDPSPRVGGALNSFVFGEEAMQSDDRVLDAERLELILSGFGSYSQSVASTKNIRKESAFTVPAPASTAGPAPPGPPPLPLAAFPSSSPLALSSGPQQPTQEDLGMLAEQILDLLLTPEPTPLQSLVFEQLAKISAAAARKSWSEAREASGALPSTGSRVSSKNARDIGSENFPGTAVRNDDDGNERSLLGYVVDPLGLFKGSALVDVDETDERALAASKKLLELISADAGTRLSVSSSSSPISQLSPDLLLRVTTQEVFPRLWKRRGAALLSANRFTTLVLQQGARRLELRRDPSSLSSSTESTGAFKPPPAAPLVSAPPSPTTHGSDHAPPRASSVRLEKARVLLGETSPGA